MRGAAVYTVHSFLLSNTPIHMYTIHIAKPHKYKNTLYSTKRKYSCVFIPTCISCKYNLVFMYIICKLYKKTGGAVQENNRQQIIVSFNSSCVQVYTCIQMLAIAFFTQKIFVHSFSKQLVVNEYYSTRCSVNVIHHTAEGSVYAMNVIGVYPL